MAVTLIVSSNLANNSAKTNKNQFYKQIIYDNKPDTDRLQSSSSRFRSLFLIFSVLISISLIVAAIAQHRQSKKMTAILQTIAGGSHEAAPYQVIRSISEDMEERRYPAQLWVTTEELRDANSYSDIKSGMFWQLFGYITGQNDQKKKIDMTIPVSTKVVAANNDQWNYQMGFYLPKAFQTDPPKPEDGKVTFQTRDLHVYTKKFGGYASESDYNDNLEKVLEYLKSSNIPIKMSGGHPVRFYVGYDSPHKFWNRKNEIWVAVEDVSSQG